MFVLWEKAKHRYEGGILDRAKQFVFHVEEYPGRTINMLAAIKEQAEQVERRRRTRTSRTR